MATDNLLSKERLSDPPVQFVTQQMWDEAQRELSDLRVANRQLYEQGELMHAKLQKIIEIVK